MSDRDPSLVRRRPTLLSAIAATTATAVGGLFLLGAVPASTQLFDALSGATVAQVVGAASDGNLRASEPQAPAEPRPGDAELVAAALDGIEIEIAPPLEYEADDGEVIDPDRIRAWLEERNSPMAPYAEDLIAAGVEHGVDPRLVVGIAAIESSAGKRLPPGSHNAWGWNGSGPHGLKAWPSWPVAIDEFTAGLARVYDTDNVDERMARKYVPPNWQKWLRTVRWVMEDI